MALILSSDWIKLALVVVATLPSSCMGAPSQAASDPSDPWWFDACKYTPAIRHSRSTNSKDPFPPTLIRYLPISFNEFSESMKKIEKLYNEASRRRVHNKKFAWHKRFLSRMRRLKEKKHSKKMLRVFHDTLQHFAGNIEKLQHLQIHTEAMPNFDRQKRERIYENVSTSTRRLLCEVQHAFRELNEELPKRIPLKDMHLDYLPASVDLSTAYLYDMTLFKNGKSFLRFAKTFFRKMRKTKQNKKQTSSGRSRKRLKKSEVKHKTQ